MGRRFLSVKVGAKRLRQQSSPSELRRWVLGGASRACAAGEVPLFDLEGGVTLLIHLGMTGRLLVGRSPPLPCPMFTWCFSWKAGWNCLSRIFAVLARSWSFPRGWPPRPWPRWGPSRSPGK